ncbi:MAG: xanthan lyase [Rubricoccaceae bacterium]
MLASLRLLLVAALVWPGAPLAQAPGLPASSLPDARPLVRSLDRPYAAPAGLDGRHLALWPSHGWYFEHARDRWQWQRARVFTTVEDLLPSAFLDAFLLPMLEGAGAVTLLPRERDPSPHEAVVDGDGGADGAVTETGRWATGATPGFAHRPPYADGVNPFHLGTWRWAETTATPSATTTWQAVLPASGDYAVHVAYAMGPGHAEDARYTVYHAGGATRFAVNQTMGGGTWVYLGTFRFEAGKAARVVLTNESATPGRIVSADAVRFGGGRGNVARGGPRPDGTSGRPRFAEAARYYLQFAGAPARVYNPSGTPDQDYRDDFQGRGEWVSFLRRPPGGAEGAPPGLGVPVDLAFAFHTDAGTTRDGSVVGTLVIHHTRGPAGQETYPDGSPRTRSTALAESLFAHLGRDLRALHAPAWTMRSIWDRPYSEATRPEVPAVLLELLSHHNFEDMRYGLDPGFRFSASRAIYKALGRWLAAEAGRPFVVQPLPVSHVRAAWTPGGVHLAWRPVEDPLEPSAAPAGYVVETRLGTGGWDNGRYVPTAEALLPPPPPGVVAAYRVRAVNAGGASLPSVAVAVGRPAGPAAGGPSRLVLVVDGFDRVAGPAVLGDPAPEGPLLAFAEHLDPGMPYQRDVAFVGAQYGLDAREAWRDDDSPGHGASHAAYEARVTAGNTRDYAAAHGRALLAAGHAFASASADAVADGLVDLGAYAVASVLLGAQRTTRLPGGGLRFEALPPALRLALAYYLHGGGRLLVSGAHWATDAAGPGAHPAGEAFLRDVLGVRWRSDFAATDGRVVAVRAIPGGLEGGARGTAPRFDDADEAPALLPPGTALGFAAARNAETYHVPAPDALEPADALGATVLRYAESQLSAGVARQHPFPVVALGFPVEALPPDEQNLLMAAALAALLRD